MHRLVLDLWKNPTNKVSEDFVSTKSEEGVSPVCGDRVVIHVTEEGLFYSGSMCAICNASASALVTDPTSKPEWLEEIARDHPMRAGCVELPWKTYGLIKSNNSLK